MKRWGVLIGMAILSGLGALAGGLGFLLLYNTFGPGPEDEHRFDHLYAFGDDHGHHDTHGDDHGDDHGERTHHPQEEAAGEETSGAPDPTEVPAFAVRVTSHGPHPAVDRELLGRVSWVPCAKHKGAVSIMAMRDGDELVSPLVLSEDPSKPNPDLEQCVSEQVDGLSVSGAPSDYFMLRAQLRME